MREKLYTWASLVILVMGIIVGIWLFFTYGLGLLSPFIFAWLLSRLIRPVVNRMTRKNAMPRGLAAGLLVLLFVGGLIGVLTWAVGRGVSELGKLMEGLSRTDSPISQMMKDIQNFFTSVSSHIPFLQDNADQPQLEAICRQIDTWVQEGATQMLKTLGQSVPAMVMGVLSSLPTFLIYITSLLFSCYYFSADDGKLWQGCSSCLSPIWQERFEHLRDGASKAARKYVRAYLLLGGITFLEMFVGLTILGVPYAFLIAWGIAVVDFLPLLGTGAVLIPWSIVMFVTGNMRMGLGLLILFGVSSLMRQLLEPKFVSRELGLHPLVSLMAVFVGWKLFGVWGMLLAPLIALLAKALLQNRRA